MLFLHSDTFTKCLHARVICGTAPTVFNFLEFFLFLDDNECPPPAIPRCFLNTKAASSRCCGGHWLQTWCEGVGSVFSSLGRSHLFRGPGYLHTAPWWTAKRIGGGNFPYVHRNTPGILVSHSQKQKKKQISSVHACYKPEF